MVGKLKTVKPFSLSFQSRFLCRDIYNYSYFYTLPISWNPYDLEFYNTSTHNLFYTVESFLGSRVLGQGVA